MKPEGKMGSPDTAWTPQVRIKICGLTRAEDARLALTLGADYLGFIFACSPRQVAAEAVRAILSSLEQEQSGKLSGVERLGVFINADRGFIEETARRANLSMLQLHGDENPEACSRFELPVIKALRIRDRSVSATGRLILPREIAPVYPSHARPHPAGDRATEASRRRRPPACR